MTDLTCPKCQSSMRRYERNGVHVDQCTGCGGLFLDRGELEHLVQAEAAWAAPALQAPRQQSPPQQSSQQQSGGYPSGGQGYSGSGHPRKKKRSFLEDLFD